MSMSPVPGAMPGVATTFHSPRLTCAGENPHVESMRGWAKRARTAPEHERLVLRLGPELRGEDLVIGQAVLREEQRERAGTGRERAVPGQRVDDRARHRHGLLAREVDARRSRGPVLDAAAEPEARDGQPVVDVRLVEVLRGRLRSERRGATSIPPSSPAGPPRPARGRREPRPGVA